MLKLVQTMQARLLSFYRRDVIDDHKFAKRMIKLNYVMEQCEKHKALEPQFSLHINELIEHLKVEEKANRVPNPSASNFSQTSGGASVFTGLDMAQFGMSFNQKTRGVSETAGCRFSKEGPILHMSKPVSTENLVPGFGGRKAAS